MNKKNGCGMGEVFSVQPSVFRSGTHANRHTVGFKLGRFCCGMASSLRLRKCSVFSFQYSVVNRRPSDLNTEHWILNTLLTLLLLAALAQRAEAQVSATGGTMTTNGGYIVHTFTTVGSSTFNVSSSGNVEVLVVAGGGGGGGRYGGGGGAGGLIYSNAFPVVAGSNYTVTVGGGGAGGANTATSSAKGGNGTNSVFGPMTAVGGGGGGAWGDCDGQTDTVKSNTWSGGDGGSGGGEGAHRTSPVSRPGHGTAGQGNDGAGYPGGDYGGGGGAGAAGSSSTGGVGLAHSISGTTTYYAGGGGGLTAPGGLGGGGTGGNSSAGSNATVNTGGGGGGGLTGVGGNGGSGIVIVRYTFTPRYTVATPVPSQMKIAFGGYTNRSEVLTNFPVLVVFSNNVNNSGFNYDNFASANGYDLRFATNATDTTNSLNYEIESWNTNGASYVWVQVPTIPTNGTGAIWANWGNLLASSQLPCTINGAVWTNGYVTVWHLPNGTTFSGNDSTTNSNTAGNNNGVTAVAGKVDGAANFASASSQYLLGSKNSGLSGDLTATIESWLYIADTSTMGTGPHLGNGNGSLTAFALTVNVRGTGVVSAEFAGNNPAQSAASALAVGTWYHVAAVKTPGAINTTTKVLINGVDYGLGGTPSTSTPNVSANPPAAGAFYSALGLYFNGRMDEVRISSVARSTNWVWACYLNQASNTVFNNYGKMEKQASPKGTVIMMR